jgi:adenylate cyclase
VLDFPILKELKAAGATDYLILPLHERGERTSFVSYAADRPGGFSDTDIARLEGLVPAMAIATELISARRMTSDLLEVYLGRDAARRVLAGEVKRGTGSAIRAVLWHCDLKGFTAIADTTEATALITLLDDYFEAMARPVEARGGEVLKFIGDGILAVFRLETMSEASAVAHALDASFEAIQNLAALNKKRTEAGLTPLISKLALHLGEVVYGNVGAADRLDFTVIGPAVNSVARIQALCGELDEQVLASAEFAQLAPARLVSRGLHHLRGLALPTELFALDGQSKAKLVQVKSSSA